MSRALATVFLAPAQPQTLEPFPHTPGCLLQRKPLLKGVGGDSNWSRNSCVSCPDSFSVCSSAPATLSCLRIGAWLDALQVEEHRSGNQNSFWPAPSTLSPRGGYWPRVSRTSELELSWRLRLSPSPLQHPLLTLPYAGHSLARDYRNNVFGPL